MRRLLVITGLVLLSVPALAHKPSDSYLRLDVDRQSIQGQWDIALRDLDYAIGLDSDDDGAITWGEVRTHHGALAAYALSHLDVKADNVRCETHPTEHLIDHHSDGAYVVLRFAIDCPVVAPQTISLRYGLFFDLDPLHRGLLRIEHGKSTHTAVLSPAQPERIVDLVVATRWREFREFGGEGVWHIWIGYDHILFLLSLLLPAVLRRGGGHWQAVSHFRPAFFEVFKIVTAFTLAHSITLSLAVLDFITLPSHLVESMIAASVVAAALNNLYPVITRRLWMVAFAFGLIHGMGFASVLIDLGLREGSLLTALIGFNLGVELGQLVIVGIFLPLAFAVRYSWGYRRVAMGLGSLLIAVVGATWLLDRSLGLDLGLF